jgi:hypothetical protein
MLTITDWESLTEFKKEQDDRYLKQNKTKKVSSVVIIILILAVTYINDLKSDFLFILVPFSFSIIVVILAFLVKSVPNVERIAYATNYIYIAFLWYYCLYIHPGITGIMLFFGTMIIYFHELEKGSKYRLVAFAGFVILLFISIPMEVEMKIYLTILMLSILSISYQNIKVNHRMTLLNQQQISFALFEKHRRYLEHKTINSLTRMQFYLMNLKNRIASKELDVEIDQIKDEIDQIEWDVKNTDAKVLKSFKI